MNIEEAVIRDARFLARVREAVGPLGTAQIAVVIHEFLEEVSLQVMAGDDWLPAQRLLDDDFECCESCGSILIPENQKKDEEGLSFCRDCHELEKRASA